MLLLCAVISHKLCLVYCTTLESTTTALTTPRFVNIKYISISLVSSANDFEILIDFIYSLNSTFTFTQNSCNKQDHFKSFIL